MNMQIDQEVNQKVSRSILERLRSYGPGIIAVLCWLGAGDLVDASLAGAHYGYSLMWVLAISLLLRYLIVNVMARYQLCNSDGVSILEGYARLHKFYPYFFLIYAFIMGHLFNSYMIKGAGEALAALLGFGHSFMWSVVVVIAALFILGKSIYHTLENLMKVSLSLMTIAFLVLAVWSTPDVGQIVKGTIGFGIPEDEGFYGAFLLIISITGAVAGSIANFVHPYFMKDKGWISPDHKKLQRNDLLFAICVAIVIDLAVWIVGAEILKPNGIEINDIHDLSKALSLYLGHAGSVIFYLGVFSILFSSVVGKTSGFPKLLTDALQLIKKERRIKYGNNLQDDPAFKFFVYFMLISPIIWSIPGMPGFITLVVGVNALNIIGFPVISVGLLILSNQKMLGKYRNNWFENVLLAAATVLAIWSSVKLAMNLFS